MAEIITVPATIESQELLTAFAEEQMEIHECPRKTAMKINIVIDEIFSNIAQYAYAGRQGDATVSIDFTEEPRAVKLIFMDSGSPYNPLENADPDITLSAEEREQGGLGIFLVKKSVDEITYHYENGRNILTVTKLY